jgi:hypothetical protein
MSEEWLKSAVAEHIDGVFESMTELVSALQNPAAADSALERLISLNRDVLSSVLPVSEFDALMPALESFDSALVKFRAGGAAMDSRTAAVLEQAVRSIRLASLAVSSRGGPAPTLPQALSELCSVLGNIGAPESPPHGDAKIEAI